MHKEKTRGGKSRPTVPFEGPSGQKRFAKNHINRINRIPYMTLTPLHTLTHRRQVKDNVIILQKLSTQTVSVAIRAINNMQKKTD